MISWLIWLVTCSISCFMMIHEASIHVAALPTRPSRNICGACVRPPCRRAAMRPVARERSWILGIATPLTSNNSEPDAEAQFPAHDFGIDGNLHGLIVFATWTSLFHPYCIPMFCQNYFQTWPSFQLETFFIENQKVTAQAVAISQCQVTHFIGLTERARDLSQSS